MFTFWLAEFHSWELCHFMSIDDLTSKSKSFHFEFIVNNNLSRNLGSRWTRISCLWICVRVCLILAGSVKLLEITQNGFEYNRITEYFVVSVKNCCLCVWGRLLSVQPWGCVCGILFITKHKTVWVCEGDEPVRNNFVLFILHLVSFSLFLDYLNNLSPDSKEYEDTQGIFASVSQWWTLTIFDLWKH